MDNKNLYASSGFLNERFTLNEIEELEQNSLPTAAVQSQGRHKYVKF